MSKREDTETPFWEDWEFRKLVEHHLDPHVVDLSDDDALLTWGGKYDDRLEQVSEYHRTRQREADQTSTWALGLQGRGWKVQLGKLVVNRPKVPTDSFPHRLARLTGPGSCSEEREKAEQAHAAAVTAAMEDPENSSWFHHRVYAQPNGFSALFSHAIEV